MKLKHITRACTHANGKSTMSRVLALLVVCLCVQGWPEQIDRKVGTAQWTMHNEHIIEYKYEFAYQAEALCSLIVWALSNKNIYRFRFDSFNIQIDCFIRFFLLFSIPTFRAVSLLSFHSTIGLSFSLNVCVRERITLFLGSVEIPKTKTHKRTTQWSI